MLHVLHGAPGHVGRAGEVDREGLPPDVLPLLVGHVGDQMRKVDAGVVDHHVQAAEVRVDLVDHLPDGLGVGQVGICASQYGPAPMPTVGIRSVAETLRPRSAGTDSSTTANAPASWSARASASS